MPAFRIKAKALEDMKSIGRFTEDKWGQVQRNKYLEKLDNSFHALARQPDLGRACNEIRMGYRVYHVGRHLIFYRQRADSIEIIRILHDRMDVETHLI